MVQEPAVSGSASLATPTRFIYTPLNSGSTPDCTSAFRESLDTYIQVACKTQSLVFPQSVAESLSSVSR